MLAEDQLSELVATAVRMMDNVVDASKFPLEAQAREAAANRRIGLGVTGLADALLMVGLRYGSEEAARQTERWMHQIARAAYLASVDLAKEKGAFPLFDAEKFLASGTMQAMDDDVRDAIREHGIRNALPLIAPTGTISLYAGNVSNGIGPVFAYSYTQRFCRSGSKTEEEVVDYAVQMWRELKGDAPLPDYFVNAQTLAPLDHVRMQAAAQKWMTVRFRRQSIARKTFPLMISRGFMALGIKAVRATTYRPNDVTGSVLSVSETEKKHDEDATPAVDAAAMTGEVVYMSEPLDATELEGQTYKLKWPDSEHAIYITINDIVVAGHNRPFEIFINSKNMEHFAAVALTRMISARRGGDVSLSLKS